jgi:hypothetical protein
MGTGVSTHDDVDDARRRFLERALQSGWLIGGLGWMTAGQTAPFGEVPTPLPAGRSVFRVRGDVRVNGLPATLETLIGPDDRIETGDDGELVAAVGSDAFLIRRRSSVNLGLSAAKQAFRLVTGAMLTVFGQRQKPIRIHTPTATIGIRGTGVYAAADGDRTYLCTCYGSTELQATLATDVREQITARHHDAPRYILGAPEAGSWIIPAPFIDHEDVELRMLEALVGREVPFAITDDAYLRPRREY